MKMKKRMITMLILPFLLWMGAISVHAAEEISAAAQTGPEPTVIFLDDGSRLVISPVYEPGKISSAKTAATTITEARDVVCEDPNGNAEWKYTLTATFSYQYGVSSTCTNASYTQTIYDNKWTFADGSASKSGNTAYGKGSYTKKILGIVVKSYNIDISLSCDIYGNVK